MSRPRSSRRFRSMVSGLVTHLGEVASMSLAETRKWVRQNPHYVNDLALTAREYIEAYMQLEDDLTTYLLLAKRERAAERLRYAEKVKDVSEALRKETFAHMRTLAHVKIMQREMHPKRKMTKERIETAEAYERLRKSRRKEAAALQALVQLPSERDKRYAKNFRASGDGEKLRNYVKQLMKTYRVHQKKWRLTDAEYEHLATAFSVPPTE